MEQTKNKFRLLTPADIEVRVGQASKDGAPSPWYTLLLYKDARCDMSILDDTVGPENWRRTHYVLKDIIYCSVGIRNDDGTWTNKDDCGTESNTEKEKGESSDSFKRACVNWGIGRELYTSPLLFVRENAKETKRTLYVDSITYFAGTSIIDTVVIKDKRDSSFLIKGSNR